MALLTSPLLITCREHEPGAGLRRVRGHSARLESPSNAWPLCGVGWVPGVEPSRFAKASGIKKSLPVMWPSVSSSYVVLFSPRNVSLEFVGHGLTRVLFFCQKHKKPSDQADIVHDRPRLNETTYILRYKERGPRGPPSGFWLDTHAVMTRNEKLDEILKIFYRLPYPGWVGYRPSAPTPASSPNRSF